MSRYTLKIRLSDGIELDFNTTNRGIVASQLNEYFEIMNHGKAFAQTWSEKDAEQVTKTPPMVVEGPVEEKIAKTPSIEPAPATSSSSPFLQDDEWETQQEDIAEAYIEKYPDAPLRKKVIGEPAVCFSSECSIDLLTKDIKDKSKDLFSAFIISAYFIKHNLDTPNFSIKLLNSKLHEASGKLIDHDIISEGLNKGYLTIVEDDNGPLKYSLSQKGEEYYSKL